MAAFTYEELREEYDSFHTPTVKIVVKGKDIGEDKNGLVVSDIEVEITCGFEASIATFWIYNCFMNGSFQFDKIKKYVAIGSDVVISIGYASAVREVFRGFISKVSFEYRREDIPGVEVTAMDVKGIMMSGTYSKQLKATTWSDAVAEIMENTAYSKLQSNEIIKKLEISETPDKKEASVLGGLPGLDAIPGLDAVPGLDAIPGVSDLANSALDAAKSTAENAAKSAVQSAVSSVASAAAGAAMNAANSLTGGAAGAALEAAGGVAGVANAASQAMDAANKAADAAKDASKALNSLSKATGAIPGVPGVPGIPGTATDKTIEMVCESDYEFVVKAAKKFNYEFFTNAGTVYFRPAKDYKDILMEIEPNPLLRSFEVDYDITGLVGKVEVRATDAGKASAISSSKSLNNKISQGNMAKPLVKDTKKVYIDPTVSSKKDAQYRAEYLAEDISYRFGTLEAELMGIPELVPGRFIKLKGLGTAVSNTFYLVTVRHIMTGEGEFITKITGKAAKMEDSLGGVGALTSGLDSAMDAVGSATSALQDGMSILDDVPDLSGFF